MRAATKMLMLTGKYKGGGDVREHYPMRRYPMYEEPEEEMYDEFESRRRRRDRRGRFVSEMDDEYEDYDRPRQIGFRYEDDMGRYRARADYQRMNEGEHRYGKMEMGRAESKRHKGMNRRMAEQWTESMRNADGSTGPHWSMDQTKQVMEKRDIDCDPVEFWVTMNMLYSDYSKVVKAHGITSVDFYADLAKAFLDDEDAVENKLVAYYEYIVE